MNVELTPQEREMIIRRASDRVTQTLIQQALKGIDPNQIRSEIKNQVIQRLADELYAKVTAGDGISVKKAVDKALHLLQRRLDGELQKALAQGITVSFTGLPALDPNAEKGD
ncbi:hypothetical protein F1188_16060 [Roseospira marina]|uniref:Uncharacterized protein n=1 Tax=Roseospira marina TaxID=140057 RepID=A0A5M6I9H8_9PROT|nr:hypothetical protein [Roseospira marina]KAA5604375.1 hypothetical protein F1188_16060 [Roseospira marina]MBB4315438.1 hypothetical protein [Roseospira marina]MBB5088416.1 hypothetical protein [Roseospira marina]